MRTASVRGVAASPSRNLTVRPLSRKVATSDSGSAKRGAARWSRCTLSEEELTPPLVMDGLGQLFNKEALINALLTQSLPRQLQHITRIGDVFDVKLTPSDESKLTSSSLKGKCGAATSAAMFSGTSSLDKCLFMCPVTGLPFNGKFRFVALLETGEVLSAKAVREIHS
ncbi:MAG: replication termination factor 2 family protein, partial [Candidatus Poseidoniia archaeon]